MNNAPMQAVYDTAIKYNGTWEWAEGDNPLIVKWFADVGHPWVKNDETAWCAAFVGAMLKECGLPNTGKLTARSYLEWGEPVDLTDIQRGDLAVFWRLDPDGWQGHVAIVDREGESVLFVLGGNQSNQINVRAYDKKKLLGVRRMTPPAQEQEPVGFLAQLVKAIINIFGGKV